jgi:anti-sigma regulatory factor (Ser/Thr protein kinase)
VLELIIGLDDVRIAVTDGGSPTVPMIQPLDPTQPGGRGLFLVDTLSDRWGMTRQGPRETRVWFEMGRLPPSPADIL